MSMDSNDVQGHGWETTVLIYIVFVFKVFSMSEVSRIFHYAMNAGEFLSVVLIIIINFPKAKVVVHDWLRKKTFKDKRKRK